MLTPFLYILLFTMGNGNERGKKRKVTLSVRQKGLLLVSGHMNTPECLSVVRLEE